MKLLPRVDIHNGNYCCCGYLFIHCTCWESLSSSDVRYVLLWSEFWDTFYSIFIHCWFSCHAINFCTVNVWSTMIDQRLYIEARWLCLPVHHVPYAKQSTNQLEHSSMPGKLHKWWCRVSCRCTIFAASLISPSCWHLRPFSYPSVWN